MMNGFKSHMTEPEMQKKKFSIHSWKRNHSDIYAMKRRLKAKCLQVHARKLYMEFLGGKATTMTV